MIGYNSPMKKTKQKSKSTVQHTRAIQVDKQKRPLADNLTEEVEALFSSVTYSEKWADANDRSRYP